MQLGSWAGWEFSKGLSVLSVSFIGQGHASRREEFGEARLSSRGAATARERKGKIILLDWEIDVSVMQ